MTKLLYKPLGMAFGVLGGVAATAAFNRVWKLLSGQDDAPSATEQNRSWGEVLSAAAIQGAIFGFVKALADRSGAAGFRKLTGTWPGDEGPERADDDNA